jgi:hypothetical protein
MNRKTRSKLFNVPALLFIIPLISGCVPVNKISELDRRQMDLNQLNYKNNDSLIVDISDSNGTGYQRIDIKKITDQSILFKIVSGEKGYPLLHSTFNKLSDIRVAAVNMITDQSTLASLALTPAVRKTTGDTVERNNDYHQNIIGYPVEPDDDYDQNMQIRFAAIKKITDQTVIAKLTLRGQPYFIKEAAIEMLADQTELSRVAMDEKEFMTDLRLKAISKLTDQVTLKRLFYNWNTQIRSAALTKLDDQEFLFKIAMSVNEKFNLREAVIFRIKDQSLLSKIVIQIENDNLRGFAFNGITDQETLTKVLLENHHFLGYPESILEDLNDQQCLSQIALESSDDKLSLAAINKLTDQILLEKISFSDREDNRRTACIRKLTDQSLLTKLVLINNSWEVRMVAFGKLDADNLTTLSQTSKNKPVALAALISIKKMTWDVAIAASTKTRSGFADLLGALVLVRDPEPWDDLVIEICHRAIRSGHRNYIPALKDILYRFGLVSLAEDYINSGQYDETRQYNLPDAGMDWATSCHMQILPGSGSNRVQWGK